MSGERINNNTRIITIRSFYSDRERKGHVEGTAIVQKLTKEKLQEYQRAYCTKSTFDEYNAKIQKSRKEIKSNRVVDLFKKTFK